MLVSCLALEAPQSRGEAVDYLDRLAMFIASHNVSVVALTGRVESFDRQDDHDELNRLIDALGRLGMKYNCESASDPESRRTVALLTQLSVLASVQMTSPVESAVLATELALSPGASLDVIVSGAATTSERLAAFVLSASEQIDATKPPPAKRRGKPPKKPLGEKLPPVRMTMMMGHFLPVSGFLPASAESDESAVIAIKPGLRPRTVASIEELATSDGSVPFFAEYEL